MQIYDGNLLHILKPMTWKTRGREGGKATSFEGNRVLLPRAKSREIEADYRVSSCYPDLHPETFDSIVKKSDEWRRREEKRDEVKYEEKRGEFPSLFERVC